MQVSVTKLFTFEAAHFLPDHTGKCRNVHGHSYTVEVTVRGPIVGGIARSDNGMVVDFGDISQAWKVVWDPRVDHRLLNDLVELNGHPPTAENLCMLFFEWFKTWCFSKGLDLLRVRVWETASGYAEVTE